MDFRKANLPTISFAKYLEAIWQIWLFHRLHPNFGIGLANFLSRSSRKKNSIADEQDIPLGKEHHYQFALHHAATSDTDFYIFGHRHKPMDVHVGEKITVDKLGRLGNKNLPMLNGMEKILRYILIIINALVVSQLSAQDGTYLD